MTDSYNCNIGSWQRRFVRQLFAAVCSLRGRVTFTNLARFSPLHEQTFRRHFQKAFQWVGFNLTILRLRRHPDEPVIKSPSVACSIAAFCPKAEPRHGASADSSRRWRDARRRGWKYQFLGLLQHRAAAPSGSMPLRRLLISRERRTATPAGYSRVDFYLDQIIDLYETLTKLGVSYGVGDGFYAKQKVFDAVTGPGGEKQVILASTDTGQSAGEIVRYYRLRYQIEFVIRDAKQHTGLIRGTPRTCQARSQEKIDFHLNMSVATANLLRLLAQKRACSKRTYRREAYNRLLVGHLLSQLGLSAECDRTDPRIQSVIRTGRMAV